jgi:hypothetical protein
LALIQLEVRDVTTANTFPQGFLAPSGQVGTLPRLRLRTSILIGPDPPLRAEDSGPRHDQTTDHRIVFPALLDTGACLTSFPRPIWEDEDFAPQITWLDFDPDEVSRRLPERRRPVRVALGQHFRYRLGRVWVAAFDRTGRRMPAVEVLAEFWEDIPPPDQPQPPILLGLYGGLLENRWFAREPCFPDPQELDPSPFGQRWWLRDG